MRSVTIVGIGKTGGALAIALDRAGYNVRQFVHRSNKLAKQIKKDFIKDVELVASYKLESIESTIVIIATGDPEIENASEQLSSIIQGKPYVFHTSGSLSSSILEKLSKIGCRTGSIHPLVSISDSIRGADLFRGAYFCVEGAKPAVAEARRIVKALGGNSFTIKSDRKALYHAAAIMVAPHVVALFDHAVEMLVLCGLKRADASKVLLPLLQSTVRNLGEQTTESALTGSFARLDIEAFERHLASFENTVPDEVIQLFVLLGERSLDIVKRRDGTSNSLRAFQKRVSMAKRNPRC